MTPSERVAAWRIANPGRRNITDRARYAAHPEKQAAWTATYYATHPTAWEHRNNRRRIERLERRLGI